MAQAYIDGGPAEGNQIMAAFEEAATQMGESLNPFVEQQMEELNTTMEKIVSVVGRACLGIGGFHRRNILLVGGDVLDDQTECR